MDSVEFSIDVDAPVERVLRAFWRAEDWPLIAPHVRAIELHYDDGAVQVLTMGVSTGQRSDSFKTVRILQPAAIFFFQPNPPPALRHHCGWWHFTAAENEVTRVRSEHSFEIDPEQASRFLAAAGVSRPGGATEALREILHKNSLQTMLAIKTRLEADRGGSHESAPPVAPC